MREQRTDFGKHAGAQKMSLAGIVEPVWQNQTLTCGKCVFRDQDVDTSPCVNCHTRN